MHLHGPIRDAAEGNRMTTAYLQSRVILGAKCTPETEAKLRATSDAKAYDAVTFMLFEAHLGHKVVNCCMSGGVLDPVTREPSFTLVGLASVEALQIYAKDAKNLVFQEIKKGPTPLQEKIKATLLAVPDDTIVCFVGDMAGELDGFSKEFNPTGEPILINDFAETTQ
jgi:hypothetical protein